MQDVVTIRLGPHMELAIDGGQTVAYLNGSAPHLFIRDGSDSYRLPQGQCVPVRSVKARIINPFSRHVECLIGRGLPVRFAAENADLTHAQRPVVMSQGILQRDATTNETKFGLGVIMKRGTASIWAHDATGEANLQFSIFKGVSADYLAARPAGMMDQFNWFMTEQGQKEEFNPESPVISIRGTYTDALLAQWMASTGAPNPQSQRIISGATMPQQVLCTPDTAVFVVTSVDAAAKAVVYLRHLGLDLGDFD